MYQGITYIMLNECDMLDEKHAGRGYHTEREKEQILAKIPNDITLSNDLKNKSTQKLFTYEGRI